MAIRLYFVLVTNIIEEYNFLFIIYIYLYLHVHILNEYTAIDFNVDVSDIANIAI